MTSSCPICREPVEGNGRTATVDGRTRPVHGACVGAGLGERAAGKRRPRRIEEDGQIELFGWLAVVEAEHPEVGRVFHVPNGGKRSKATGGRLKAGGTKRGVPDVLCLVAREREGRTVPGLAVEMKTAEGSVSREQRGWLAHLAAEGWETRVARSPEEAFDAIVGYLGLAWAIVGGRAVRLAGVRKERSA